MYASLTVIKYPKIFVPAAFFAMAIHRLPLWVKKDISFYKLMGTGKNGTFDKTPDLRQWAILTVFRQLPNADTTQEHRMKILYGKFIAGWYRFFKCSTETFILQVLDARGKWNDKNVFGNNHTDTYDAGRIAVLTRATVKLTKLKYFWANVAPVAAKMRTAKGFIRSFGIGEIPWIKQATFSLWDSKADMIAFAYGMKEHTEVIKKTRNQQWYTEELFARFKIISEHTLSPK